MPLFWETHENIITEVHMCEVGDTRDYDVGDAMMKS